MFICKWLVAKVQLMHNKLPWDHKTLSQKNVAQTATIQGPLQITVISGVIVDFVFTFCGTWQYLALPELNYCEAKEI